VIHATIHYKDEFLYGKIYYGAKNIEVILRSKCVKGAEQEITKRMRVIGYKPIGRWHNKGFYLIRRYIPTEVKCD